MEFAASDRATLGIEWELALVDAATGDLVGRAPEIIAAVDDPNCGGEFLSNTVELVTGVHRAVPAAVAELRALLDAVVRACDARGLAAIGTGTHPFADWRDQEVSPAPRYQRVVELGGDWGRQLSIWGVHVHVGLPSRDAVVPVQDAVLAHLPWLLGLSGASPYWLGVDTGFASHRAMLFQQLSTGGLPPHLTDWGEYERLVAAMSRAEAIAQPGELRWDVRPAAHFGTIEVRIADAVPTLAEVAAQAALTQAIVEEALRALDAGRQPTALPLWAVRENKFRAARFGLDTAFIVSATGEVEDARSALARRVAELSSIARDLGCERELHSVLSLAQRTPAQRQRDAMRAEGARGVIDALRAELLR